MHGTLAILKINMHGTPAVLKEAPGPNQTKPNYRVPALRRHFEKTAGEVLK